MSTKNKVVISDPVLETISMAIFKTPIERDTKILTHGSTLVIPKSESELRELESAEDGLIAGYELNIKNIKDVQALRRLCFERGATLVFTEE